ncbi:L-arabinose isomerase [Agarivorans sp. MS3-6]
MNTKNLWFITGSQSLYGKEVLAQVALNTAEIVGALSEVAMPVCKIIGGQVVKSSQEISDTIAAANNDSDCIGVILWMHTFSPAKMWIDGFKQLNKPFLHLHTQFNAQLPYSQIDMNFMNTNQSAHGCREFGFIGTRMNLERKIVVGHWSEERVQNEIAQWARAAKGFDCSHHLKVARFGDNMRQVAVTEGNKVSAQIKFGYEVNAYGLGELSDYVNAVTVQEASEHARSYLDNNVVSQELRARQDLQKLLIKEAKLELGTERFLVDHDCNAFTNTFENLSGLSGLPGLATQQLMAKGYGYGGEGDWKTAALLHVVKQMTLGLSGGSSFMEDYTYDLNNPDLVLGAHMLEVCPTISKEKPELLIEEHTIGCRCDVPRLKFQAMAGPAMNLSLVDLGDRFRLIANLIESIDLPSPMPHLPVAHALWKPLPDLPTAAAAWIHAGGAHHSVYTQALSIDTIYDFAQLHDIELVIIDNETNIRSFTNELKHNSLYYKMKGLFG